MISWTGFGGKLEEKIQQFAIIFFIFYFTHCGKEWCRGAVNIVHTERRTSHWLYVYVRVKDKLAALRD